MQELIKIEKVEGKETVNARDLWKFLESNQEFTTWIKTRIVNYGFEQGTDFIQFDKLIKSKSKARIEFHLSLDMAKELSMLEKNEKGKQARKYFIECEKELKEISATNIPDKMKLPDFGNPVAAARAWADAKENELNALIELKEAKPKIEFADHVETSKDSISVAKFANLLTKGGYKIGQNNLFKWFYVNMYLIKSDRPYQKTLDSGWVEIKKIDYEDNSENEKTAHKVLITGKGQIYFTGVLKKHYKQNPKQLEF